MAMKKLINRPGAVVEEMIQGFVAVYPGLARLPGKAVVVRADAEEAKATRVAVVSGGGSGHEPAHAGYVGRGMLAAAVLGDVFTSPSPDSVLAALRAVTGPPGALLVVKNYTGDRLNFGLAAELARAEGLKVETVVVADDVALAGTPEAEHAGRRGLAGTVLVHKVAGAAAEEGLDLMEVAAGARAAAESLGTMGVALSPCTVPAAGRPGFTLGDHEVELGLGIHGEPGVRRAPLTTADDLVDQLLDAVLTDARLGTGARVALLVNNLGATPSMELAVVARRAVADLEGRGLRVERVYMGTFLSALEMAGVSLSVLRVDATRLARLDAPTDAPAWPNPAAVNRPRGRSHAAVVSPPAPAVPAPTKAAPEPSSRLPRTAAERLFEATIRAAAGALIEAGPRLNEMDREVGDGDLGLSLARGAEALKEALPKLPLFDPSLGLHSIGRVVQESIGGTSGPLYAVFFLRAAAHLRTDPDRSLIDPVFWAEALRAGCNGVIELGGAGRGDRTMLDALMPACDAFESATATGADAPEALAAAAQAAEAGAADTARLLARRGRSSYLGQRALGHPDPGASAVAVWLQAVARAYRSQDR